MCRLAPLVRVYGPVHRGGMVGLHGEYVFSVFGGGPGYTMYLVYLFLIHQIQGVLYLNVFEARLNTW